MKKIASNRNYRLLKIKNTIQLNKLGQDDAEAIKLICLKVSDAIKKYKLWSWDRVIADVPHILPGKQIYIDNINQERYLLMDDMAENAEYSEDLARCILDLMKKD